MSIPRRTKEGSFIAFINWVEMRENGLMNRVTMMKEVLQVKVVDVSSLTPSVYKEQEVLLLLVF